MSDTSIYENKLNTAVMWTETVCECADQELVSVLDPEGIETAATEFFGHVIKLNVFSFFTTESLDTIRQSLDTSRVFREKILGITQRTSFALGEDFAQLCARVIESEFYGKVDPEDTEGSLLGPAAQEIGVGKDLIAQIISANPWMATLFVLRVAMCSCKTFQTYVLKLETKDSK